MPTIKQAARKMPDTYAGDIKAGFSQSSFV